MIELLLLIMQLKKILCFSAFVTRLWTTMFSLLVQVFGKYSEVPRSRF